MHHYDHAIVQALARLAHLSYPEIFLAILASGHPLPVPEGVIFFVLGILAHGGAHSLVGVYLVSALAAFTYDIALYLLAYGGVKAVSSLSKHANAAWLSRYAGASTSHMFFLTFVSHFVPGWRMANPVIAAGLDVPPQKFVAYSILPALVYPAIYILAGFFLARI